MEYTISTLIKDFSKNFLVERNSLYYSTSNTKILTEVLPKILKNKFNLSDAYKVYGSVGSGNWSEIPWVAILDKSVSNSTMEGYYVVILFDKNLQNIYLGLAAGWTQFEKEYGIKEGKSKIQATCKYYAQLLAATSTGFISGSVNLGAENSLGKGYEVGQIISKKYPIDQLSDNAFTEDMRQLILLYQELKSIVGDSILNLEIDPVASDETLKTFKKKVAEESFSKDTPEAIVRLIEIANEAPPEVVTRLKKEILRNRKFANFVKERAHYICQICGQKPFMQENGKPYAEADHINQLGGVSKGLDSPDNMRCLCSQCHAIITYGSRQEIKNLLARANLSKLNFDKKNIMTK